MTSSEILMIVLTAVIAFTGIIGAIIFKKQLDAMQGQLTEIKTAGEYTKRAADASKEAAEATKKTVDLSEKTAERQLRAYVYAMPLQVHEFSTANLSAILFGMKNAGQTPAYKVAQWGRTEIFDFPLPPNFRFPDERINSRPGISNVYAGEELNAHVGAASSSRIFPAEEVELASASNTKRLYVFGFIKYTDIFGKLRETRFCYSVHPGATFGVGPGRNLTDLAFQAEEQYTDAS